MALDLPTVSGNQDRQLLACAEAPGGPSDQFAFEHTTEQQRAWPASLPGSSSPSSRVAIRTGRGPVRSRAGD